MKITTRLTLLLVGSVGVVYVLLQLYTSSYYADLVKKQIRTEAELVTNITVDKIRELSLVTENTVATAAVGVSAFDIKYKGDAYLFLEDMVRTNREFGGIISASALAFNPKVKKDSPFVWLKDGKFKRVNIANQYDYAKAQWFKGPFETYKPMWSAPYFDRDAADVLMVTYAYPIMDEGKVKAVLTADLYLSVLRDFLAKVSQENDNEYIFVLYNKDGRYVSHPDEQLLMKSAIDWNKNYPTLLAILHRMMQGENGEAMGSYDGANLAVVYTTIPKLGWSIGVVFDVDKIDSSVKDLSFVNAMVMCVGLLFIFLVVLVVAHSITKPLRRLADYVANIKKYDWQGVVPGTSGHDEIADLARSFSVMQNEIKKYIVSEKKNALEKARERGEIHLAETIQSSFLPEVKDVSGDERFDIAAFLSAARGVGGDLYDFFMLDKDHLLVLLGDVSDKGLPASLYMAITMAFARSHALRFSSLAEIMEHLNNDLVRYSKNNMFVTMAMFAVNLKTKKVHIVDAGHGMVYVISKGKVKRPDMPKNLALGVMSDIEFKEATFDISSGDAIFVYTDGVTDAINKKQQRFSDAGVQKMLSEVGPLASAKNGMKKIVDTLTKYIKGAHRADDIACVLLKIK